MRSFGHSWAEIQGYTLGQMRLFLREGMAIEDHRAKRAALGTRVAQHAEADQFRDFLND